ncbi:MAG: hypothetical protein N2376_07250 [Clostridia bacterium]|nr:hypothetical protein [Clostridia bacterium]
MEHVFCTVLSRLRVYQGLALYSSLKRVLGDVRLVALCADSQTLSLLRKMKLKGLTPLCEAALNEEGLLRLRRERKLNEYCWTLKPLLIEHLLKSNSAITRVTYLDADLYFYHDPTAIFRKHGQSSVLLTAGEIGIAGLCEDFRRHFQELMGDFNSGFISFKRDQSGLACLSWWKERCLEECLGEPKGGRFGDQRYLNEMPYLFNKVETVSVPGVNIGHWNAPKHHFSVHDGYLYMDQYRLVCYHFSGFRLISRNKILQKYESNRAHLPFFYKDYSAILKEIVDRVARIDPYFDGFSDREDLGLKEVKNKKGSCFT